MAQGFLESMRESGTIVSEDSAQLTEFDEKDEDDPLAARARTLTPQGCVSVRTQEDLTVQSMAKKYGISAAKLRGVNRAMNPCWKLKATAAGKSGKGDQFIIPRGSVVWIPHNYYLDSVQGEMVSAEVDKILDVRRIKGKLEYLVRWTPTREGDKDESLEIQEWEDSWVKDSDLDCQKKVEEFENSRASQIGS